MPRGSGAAAAPGTRSTPARAHQPDLQQWPFISGNPAGKGPSQQQKGMVGLVDCNELYHLLIVSGGELTDGTADEEKQNVGHGEERGEQGSSYLRHTHVIFIMDT